MVDGLWSVIKIIFPVFRGEDDIGDSGSGKETVV